MEINQQKSKAGVAAIFFRSTIAWFLLAALAVANGIFREKAISPYLGDMIAHAVSTFLLCFAIFAVTYFTVGWIGPRTGKEAFLIGLFWLGMTLAFEFLAGHYLFGNSWGDLLADYNLAKGRLWPLVLITTLLAPWLTAKWEGEKL